MKDLKDAYEAEFYCQDLDQYTTVREYLKELLLALWKEGEGFSGKHPFGSSGWERDLAVPLTESGALDGFVAKDSDGYIQDVYYKDKEYEDLITTLIEEL